MTTPHSGAMSDEPPANGMTAVCCSGGGIRSASFNLGALQELARAGVLDRTRFLVAVSGGAYIAASHALLASRGEAPPLKDVYSQGSPEEKWLRGNSRYLAPNWRIRLQGLLRLLSGIAANLLLLLLCVFISGHLLGWFLEWRGLLTGLATGQPSAPMTWAWSAPMTWAWVVPAALAGIAILLAMLTVRERPWSFVSGWAMVAAVLTALALLAAPQAIRGLYDVGLDNDGNLGTVVRGLGFASAQGCKAARQDDPDPDKAICGVQRKAVAKAAGEVPSDPRRQTGGFLAFVLALGALVRAAVGRLRGARPSDSAVPDVEASSAAPTEEAWSTKIVAVLRQAVMPWLGTLLVVGILLLFWLRWTADGAIGGYGAAESLKVLIAFVVLAVGRVAIDVNKTSMHSFYRERLASAYALARCGPSSVVGRSQTRMSELLPDGKSDPSDADWRGAKRPELVVCAAANVNVGIAGDQVPPGRAAISFTFTPQAFGLSNGPPPNTRPAVTQVPGREAELAASADYEKLFGERYPTLFDAVAVSGAAVSPLMGKMTRPAQRFLLAVANVRLGLWLPSPRLVRLAAAGRAPAAGPLSPERLQSWIFRARLHPENLSGASRIAARALWRATQPNLRLLLAETFGHNRVRTSWVYVTDGGHFDNLGLVEALRRGANEVYVFDASGDAVTTWNTLGEAIALARSELGVEIKIDPKTQMTEVRDEREQIKRPYARGRFTFAWSATAQGPKGVIHLCKLGVWPTAPWDVHAYSSRHPTFPTDSTLQQLYDDEEFEAYRALGQSATRELLDSVD